MDRATALKLIADNIKEHGFHVYMVDQSSTPRFAYTIGLRNTIGAELALPGAIRFSAVECMQILHTIRERLEARMTGKGGEDLATATGRRYAVNGLGMFTLRRAHDSWARQLLLGAFDYYRPGDVIAYQVVPDDDHRTLDVPDMSKEWNVANEPIWKWLDEPWPYPFPEDATATTNLAALRGERVTEVTRWHDGWEMFAGPGPDVTEAEMRVVPISCLVGPDPMLAPALELAVDGGIWRDAEGGPWNARESSSSPTIWGSVASFVKKLVN